MKAFPLLATVLLVGCAQTERVRVAPAVAVVGADGPVAAANPSVGGVVVPADRSIAANLVAVPTLSTLARAVEAAGLGNTLAAPGPVTVFAPTDEAFGRLAPGTVEALVKPENRAALTRLLQLHLVAGRLSSAELVRRVTAGGGRATLVSVAGEPLTLTLTGAVLTLTDSGGNRSYIATADVRGANGVVHVVNGVLVPRIGP